MKTKQKEIKKKYSYDSRTIRLSPERHARLSRLKGVLAERRRDTVTFDDVIEASLDCLARDLAMPAPELTQDEQDIESIRELQRRARRGHAAARAFATNVRTIASWTREEFGIS